MTCSADLCLKAIWTLWNQSHQLTKRRRSLVLQNQVMQRMKMYKMMKLRRRQMTRRKRFYPQVHIQRQQSIVM